VGFPSGKKGALGFWNGEGGKGGTRVLEAFRGPEFMAVFRDKIAVMII
jgi:hypothetical protein